VSEETEGQHSGAEAVAGGVDTPNTDPAQAPASKMDAVKEEAPMEIHKPKPVHSLKELLNEVGVIVISIVLALGAEQIVEAIHWHNAVGETAKR
jgi:hypothetical protein